jgi:hemoglobin/transferrin/lactoferrin receptor protein
MVRNRVRVLLTMCAAGALAVQLSAHEAVAQQAAPVQAQPAAAPGKPAAGARPVSPAQRQPGQGQANANPAPGAKQSGADVNLDTITVAPTRTEQSVVDAMAGASVITSGEIQRQQPGSIADMLQNIPGVASEVTPNDPGQSINIRGMQDFGRVNILIDGARQDYQISGHNANGTFYLDPQFVGQADVVRGPVSNIYGSGGIGGVVSFNTMGVDNVLNADETYGALQRFVVGTNGSGVVTSTSGAARVGPNLDIYGQFLYRNSSSYLDGQGNVIPDSGSSVVGGLFKLNVRPSEGQQISLSALTQNDQFANNGTSNEGARFNNNVTTGTYTLGYTYKAPWTPLIDLSSHIYYTTTQNRQTFVAPDAAGVYSALGVVPGDPLEDKINSYGFDLHNTARFTTGMLNHALTVGGDGTLDRVTTSDDAGGFISALTPSGNRSLWGAYVQDEISYNSWLRVLGALREDGYNLSGGGVTSGGTHLSPKLTIGVTPIKGIEFYGTYAQGYRAPSVTETLIEGVHPTPSFTFLPNPDLVAETAHDWETGVNVKYDNVFRPGDSVRSKATVFTNLVDNFIDLEQVGEPILTSFVPGVPNAACPSLPPGLCMPFQPFQYVNVAQARLSGVELESGYDWGAGFATFEGSAINGKNLETGMSLATVPPYRASATLGFRFLDDRSLVVGARFTAVGASPKNVPTATDGGGPLPTGGYGLVDLFASYAYNDRVSANFSVSNLLNREYTQFLNVEPNPGLTVKGGITIKFAEK